MIRLAKIDELPIIALMMRELYKELHPDHYTKVESVYLDEVWKHMEDPRDTVYLDSEYKGFFIVRDETEPMSPTLNRYNGIRLYIYPAYRKSSLLSRFYKQLFRDFPNGDILGVTEINSEHIKVLDKRHTLIAKVYRLIRS